MSRIADRLDCLVPDSFGINSLVEGPLKGKSFVVKDNIPIKGHVSSFGLARWRETHTKSDSTAPSVTKMLEAGADMVGLTKLDQFTYSILGNFGEGKRPLNPLYTDRLTCGSSSGSASAVAGKLADIGIGTDCRGSIRIPAAACGIFSIRPTYGRIDSSGDLPLAKSIDVIGLFTRDLVLLLKAFNAVDSKSDKRPDKIRSIFLPKDCLKICSPGMKDSVIKAASILAQRIGADLEEAEFDEFISQESMDLLARIQAIEVWGSYSKWVKENKSFIAPYIMSRFEKAEKLFGNSADEKAADMKDIKNYKKKYDSLIKKGSVVILPVMPDLPPKVDILEEEFSKFTMPTFCLATPSSMTGCPEIVIPVKNKERGLTYGVGLLGARDEDVLLLNSLAHALGSLSVLSV